MKYTVRIAAVLFFAFAISNLAFAQTDPVLVPVLTKNPRGPEVSLVEARLHYEYAHQLRTLDGEKIKAEDVRCLPATTLFLPYDIIERGVTPELIAGEKAFREQEIRMLGPPGTKVDCQGRGKKYLFVNQQLALVEKVAGEQRENSITKMKLQNAVEARDKALATQRKLESDLRRLCPFESTNFKWKVAFWVVLVLALVAGIFAGFQHKQILAQADENKELAQDNAILRERIAQLELELKDYRAEYVKKS